LVLETPDANLVVGMKWLLGVYNKRFNIRHKECGHLFAGCYKAVHVEGSGRKWIAEHLAMGSWTHVSNLLVAEWKRASLKSEN